MERLKLSAQTRSPGRGTVNALRRGGQIPGIVYGKKFAPITIQVSQKDLEAAVNTKAGFNTLFDLDVDGKPAALVRVRDYQADSVSRNITHVDFQAVALEEKIVVEVPIVLVGKAVGVTNGGVIESQRRTLTVKCLAAQIPGHIEIDVTLLEIGQGIHADEMKLPPGVEFPHQVNFSIVSVVPPVKEEEVAAPVPEAAEVAQAEGAPAVPGAPTPGAAGKPEEKPKAEKK